MVPLKFQVERERERVINGGLTIERKKERKKEKRAHLINKTDKGNKTFIVGCLSLSKSFLSSKQPYKKSFISFFIKKKNGNKKKNRINLSRE